MQQDFLHTLRCFILGMPEYKRLHSSLNLAQEISCLSRGLYEDTVIHCADGERVRASSLLLAAANDFWAEALLASCSTTGEEFHVFLDETSSEVSAYACMLWSGTPSRSWTGKVIRPKGSKTNVKAEPESSSTVEGLDVDVQPFSRKPLRVKRKVNSDVNYSKPSKKRVRAEDSCSHCETICAFAKQTSDVKILLVALDEQSRGQILLTKGALSRDSVHAAIHKMCTVSSTDPAKTVVGPFNSIRLDDQEWTVIDQDEFEELEMKLAADLIDQASKVPAREIVLEAPSIDGGGGVVCSPQQARGKEDDSVDQEVLNVRPKCSVVPEQIAIVAEVKPQSVSSICLLALGE